jgi:hypothetical protein
VNQLCVCCVTHYWMPRIEPEDVVNISSSDLEEALEFFLWGRVTKPCRDLR